VSQPRYAPARFQFSLRGTLFSTTVLAIALLLGLPTVGRAATGQRAESRAPLAAAQAAGAGADVQAGGQQAQGLDPIAIRPLPVSTDQPAAPVATSDGWVLGPAGETGQLGIPTMVLRAYRLAAADLATEQPSCHLPWWLLAGIGHTESGHAESGRLFADGTTRGRILGPVLDGTLADNAVITDTDHGAYDGDPVYDRAVGPMQFIPSTWAHWAADGNHDGKRDPNNIYDATLAAGRYLCADGRNLATLPGLQAAVLSYNHSQPYLDTVLAWGLAYRNGASAIADLVDPVVGDVTKVRPPLSARPPKKPRKVTPGTPASGPAPSSGSSSPSGSASASSASASATASTPAGSGGATATPTATCTSSVPTSSAASSASAAAHSGSDQPASPATSADGGSATAGSQSTSGAGSTSGSQSSQSAAQPESSTTASPTSTVSCTP
jgi:membrane-bound lytic murein transglycosylase B